MADIVAPLGHPAAVVYNHPQVVYHQQVGYLPQLGGPGPRPAWWGPRPGGSWIPRPMMAVPRALVPRAMAPRAAVAMPANRPRRAMSVPVDLDKIRRRPAVQYRGPRL